MPYYIDGELRLTESAAILRYVCEKHQPALLQPEGGRCGTTTARALHDQLFVFLLNHNAATRAFHYGYLPQVLGRLLCSAHPHTNIHAHAHAHVPLLDVIVTRTSCSSITYFLPHSSDQPARQQGEDRPHRLAHYRARALRRDKGTVRSE